MSNGSNFFEVVGQVSHHVDQFLFVAKIVNLIIKVAFTNCCICIRSL